MGNQSQGPTHTSHQRQHFEAAAVTMGCFSLKSKNRRNSGSPDGHPHAKTANHHVTCLPSMPSIRRVSSDGEPDSLDKLPCGTPHPKQSVRALDLDEAHVRDVSPEASMHDSGSSFKEAGVTRDKLHDAHKQERRAQDAPDIDSAEELEDEEDSEHVLRAEWQIDPLDIFFCSTKDNKLLKLGKGGFGTVYKGVWKERKVAVKVCRQQLLTAKVMKQFQTEVAILNSCSHPNVVQFIGACCWKGGKRTVLVTEYMEKGDLCTAIGRAPHIYAWNNMGKKIALDIAKGLAFLHSRNVVHFDLKSANILLDKRNRAKLADVGLSKTLTEYHGEDQLSTFLATGDLGTFAWAAPEVLLGFSCNCQADIFSFGVLMWELATGEMPQGRCLRPLRVPEEAPEQVAAVIMDCLRHDPARRPSAQDLLQTLQELQ